MDAIHILCLVYSNICMEKNAYKGRCTVARITFLYPSLYFLWDCAHWIAHHPSDFGNADWWRILEKFCLAMVMRILEILFYSAIVMRILEISFHSAMVMRILEISFHSAIVMRILEISFHSAMVMRILEILFHSAMVMRILEKAFNPTRKGGANGID